MRFRCCEYFLHELVFGQSEVIPCCCSPKHNYDTKFLQNYSGENFDISEYIRVKNKYIEMFKEGQIPSCCKDCSMIKENDWNDTESINRIIISNRTKCSCNCIYCSLVTTCTQTKEELNTRKAYNILPVLKDLRNKNLIKKDCEILIAGGECCEYPKGELEEIIYIASSLNCKLEILSSGIIYSKAIENALKSTRCTLKISVDSGSKAVFEKIKRVKAYNNVWINLKRYINYSKQNLNSNVTVKYIILPGINDKLKEAKAFINKCRSINCERIELTVEYLWLDKNKDNPIPIGIKKIVSYMKKSKIPITYETQSKEYLQKI